MSQTCSTTIISLFPNTEQSSVVAKITIRKRRKRQKSTKEQTQKEELKPKVVVISEDLFNPEYIAEVQKQKEKEEPEEENEEEETEILSENENKVLELLKNMDLNSLSPLESLLKLNELKKILIGGTDE